MEAQCGFTAVTQPSLYLDRVSHCSALPPISIKRERMIFDETNHLLAFCVLLRRSYKALNLYSILGELSSIIAENFKVFQDLKSRTSNSVMYIKYTIIFPGRINHCPILPCKIKDSTNILIVKLYV